MALFLTLNIGGLVLLIASSFAAVWNRRVVVQDRPALWQRLWRQRWQVGLLLGLLSFFSGYVKVPTTVYQGFHAREGFIRGIPFVVGGGIHGVPEDLPPPFVVIIMQLNFLFWLLLPQFVLWATSGRRPTTHPGTPNPH